MKKTWIVLSLLFLFAYALRVWYLPQNALTFGYDQARDHIQAANILAGDIKIQGPSASTPGMHHGVFWFYYLVPPVLFSGGNPIASAYWNAFFNAAVIFIVFTLGYKMTKKKSAGFIAALFFAVSFESTQYAVWLSNPTVAAWTVPLMYLGLWMWIKENKYWGALATGLGLGLSVQANVFLLYQSVPVLIWMWVSRTKITKKQLLGFIGAGFFATFTMLLSEIKFGFKSIGGVLSLASAQDAVIASKKFGDFVVLFLNQIGNVYSFNSYPGNVAYGGMLILLLIFFALRGYKAKKADALSWEPFLAIWLLAHSTVASVGGASTPFLLVGIGPAVSLILGIFVSKWWDGGYKALSLFVIALLLYGNLHMIFTENKRGQTIFAIQKDMLLSKQIELVDYTYQKADGEMFSVNSLTSPLWINIVWTYLYEWHGNEAFGYIPEWHGKGQEGQLVSLPPVTEGTSRYYLILEPMGGIPQRYLPETLAEEDSKSTLIEETNWGELRVQKRERKQ